MDLTNQLRLNTVTIQGVKSVLDESIELAEWLEHPYASYLKWVDSLVKLDLQRNSEPMPFGVLKALALTVQRHKAELNGYLDGRIGKREDECPYDPALNPMAYQYWKVGWRAFSADRCTPCDPESTEASSPLQSVTYRIFPTVRFAKQLERALISHDWLEAQLEESIKLLAIKSSLEMNMPVADKTELIDICHLESSKRLYIEYSLAGGEIFLNRLWIRDVVK